MCISYRARRFQKLQLELPKGAFPDLLFRYGDEFNCVGTDLLWLDGQNAIRVVIFAVLIALPKKNNEPLTLVLSVA